MNLNIYKWVLESECLTGHLYIKISNHKYLQNIYRENEIKKKKDWGFQKRFIQCILSKIEGRAISHRYFTHAWPIIFPYFLRFPVCRCTFVHVEANVTVCGPLGWQTKSSSQVASWGVSPPATGGYGSGGEGWAHLVLSVTTIRTCSPWTRGISSFRTGRSQEKGHRSTKIITLSQTNANPDRMPGHQRQTRTVPGILGHVVTVSVRHLSSATLTRDTIQRVWAAGAWITL